MKKWLIPLSLATAMALPATAIDAKAPQRGHGASAHSSVSYSGGNAHASNRGKSRWQREQRRSARSQQRGNVRSHQRARYKYGVKQFRAPFRYTSFRTGARVPGYAMSRAYVIGNPRAYGLRHARAGTRYVRHYDDVLLINVHTGRVLRVYNNWLRW